MLVSGLIGIAAGLIPHAQPILTCKSFGLYWTGVSFFAILVGFLLVRKQALKEAEVFFSPPTKRVTQALLPSFFLGLITGLFFVLEGDKFNASPALLAIFWTAIYGCALHAAGFFMQRGIKLFAWLFLLGSSLLLFGYSSLPPLQSPESAHNIMGGFFGVLHLAYGIYLYFTEHQRKSV
jgi:hypothetical protein